MMIAVQKGAVRVAVATTISEVKVLLRKPNCSELPKPRIDCFLDCSCLSVSMRCG